MRVLPFALVGASVMGEVTRRVSGAVEGWRSDWGLGHLDSGIECLRAWEAVPQHPAIPWQRRYAESGKSAWFAWQPEFVKYIQRQMFPPDQRHLMQPQNVSSIAFDAAEKAVLALADRLAQTVSLHVACGSKGSEIAPNESTFVQGSGAVLASLKLGEQPVLCLLSHDCVRAMNGKAAPMTPDPIHKAALNKALGRIPVALPIEVGQVEVDVGSLLTLAVGDVIRLQTSVDKPLTVYGPDRAALFDGHLGAVEGSVAIEVARRDK